MKSHMNKDKFILINKKIFYYFHNIFKIYSLKNEKKRN